MAEQTYSQEFNGYWIESNKAIMPTTSGVYCVYECNYDTTRKTVTLNKLIYIGESENINTRIANHEKLPLWKRQVKAGNILCYSYTPINAPDRFRVEAALINHHQPPANIEYKDNFPFDKTIVHTNGRNAQLERVFVVNRK